jgi:hypothetical protein
MLSHFRRTIRFNTTQPTISIFLCSHHLVCMLYHTQYQHMGYSQWTKNLKNTYKRNTCENTEFRSCSTNEYLINRLQWVFCGDQPKWYTMKHASLLNLCASIIRTWCDCMFSLYEQCRLPKKTSETKGLKKSVPGNEDGVSLGTLLLLSIDHLIWPKRLLWL